MGTRVNFEGINRDIGLMVQSLARNIHDHDRSESSVPKTIKFMFTEYPENNEGIKYNWQCFTIPETGETIKHKHLVNFVTTNAPKGLGTTIGKLEVWVKAELPEYLPMLKDSKIPEMPDHGEIGHGRSRAYNVSSTNHGNSETYIISRLKRDNPELAIKVMNGEISATKAAIQSGIMKRYVSVRCEPDGFVNKIRKEFSDEQIRYIKDHL